SPPTHKRADSWSGPAGIFGTKVDHAGLVGSHSNLDIQSCPSFPGDLFLQRIADLVLGLLTEFYRDQFLGARAQTPADIVAGDHEICALVFDPTDKQVNEGFVCVLVVNSGTMTAC